MPTSFEQRVRNIENDTTTPRSTVVYYALDEKIIIKNRQASLPVFPWRPLVGVLLLLVIAKAGIFHALGEATYTAQVMQIGQASIVEKAGSFVLHADPATRALAKSLEALGVPQLR